MELCKALEELHVELEDILLEQQRARDELPLMQQADDFVTLPTDLETMNLITAATSQPALRATEPLQLRNDFEDFFGTRRSQLICSAEIALPILMSWYLLVVGKPTDTRFRSDKSTEQILAETTRLCPRCFVLIRRAGGCVHMTCGDHRCQHEFCWFCLHDWTIATYNASFCTGRAEASHSEVLASVERQIRSNWALHARDTQPAVDTFTEDVLQRFSVALTTRLESDAEPFSAGRRGFVPLRGCVRWCSDSHCAQQELTELLSWVRDSWWLRLSLKDVDAHNESFIDPQAWMAANGMTNGMGSALLVPALRLPALPAVAPAPASQQDSRVLLPASRDDCDVSMDLTA